MSSRKSLKGRKSPSMLAKLTSMNRLTLPKAIVSLFPGTKYFEVAAEDGRIVLTPLDLERGDAVRRKLAELGLDLSDVSDGIRWARSDRPATKSGQ